MSPDDGATLVCHVLAARSRARVVAAAEAVALFSDLGAVPLAGGPGGDLGGVFWLQVPDGSVMAVTERATRLGYCDALWQVMPAASGTSGVVRSWHHRQVRLAPLYAQDRDALREEAPDRAEFVLETAAGVRSVRGYRGDGGALSRRALPVCDSRMLVNLHGAADGRVLLDPFAGAGGVIRQGNASGWRTLAADIDPAMRHGLAALASEHHVADARHLPLPDHSVDAISTESPYDAGADAVVVESCREMLRVLVAGGRVCALVSAGQGPVIASHLRAEGWTVEINQPIDRKGLPVHLLLARSPISNGRSEAS